MAEMENTCSLVRCMQEVPDLRAPYNQRHKFLDIIIIAVTARHPLRNGYLERVRTGHVPKKNGWGHFWNFPKEFLPMIPSTGCSGYMPSYHEVRVIFADGCHTTF